MRAALALVVVVVVVLTSCCSKGHPNDATSTRTVVFEGARAGETKPSDRPSAASAEAKTEGADAVRLAERAGESARVCSVVAEAEAEAEGRLASGGRGNVGFIICDRRRQSKHFQPENSNRPTPPSEPNTYFSGCDTENKQHTEISASN